MESMLVCVLLCLIVQAAANSLECCDTSYFISSNITSGDFLCHNLVTNSTTELNLQCDPNSKARNMILGIYCKKNDNDHLDCDHPSASVKFTYMNGTYCEGTRRLLTKRGYVKKAIKLVCEIQPVADVISSETIAYCMITSVAFLFITAAIYGVLPELRDLEGWSYINLCVSQGIAFNIFAVMRLVPYYSDAMKMCAARGFFAYFFLIAAFFWVNAIAIQILKSVRPGIMRPFVKKELMFYMIYAWGFAALLTIIVAIVNYVEGDHSRPGIGLNTCWFKNDTELWIYLYSVLLILLVINAVIFFYVSYLLRHHLFSSNNITTLKYKCNLIFKLLFTMGLPWIFEMMSSLHFIFEILGLVNVLVGVTYFLFLVVLRKRVIKALHKRGWLLCCSGFVERHLAKVDDEEDKNIEHTEIPMESVMR